MITVRKSGERGVTKSAWLDSRHSFSAGGDPTAESFGPLRVLNEHWIAAGAGFPPHPHRDMEIVTYVLDGAVRHRGSTGGEGTVRAGEILRLSAGTGLVHAEFNASGSEACHLLQIWIAPSEPGLEPGYEQKRIDPAAVTNHFARIAAPDPVAGEVRLRQDAEIWAARLDAGVEAIHPLTPGRKAWLHVARGEIAVDGEHLGAGDAAAITDQERIAVRSRTAAEVLLFDLG